MESGSCRSGGAGITASVKARHPAIPAASTSSWPRPGRPAAASGARGAIDGVVPLVDRLVGLSRLRVLRPALRQILALLDTIRRED